MAKGSLKELLAEKGLRVMFSGAVDKTQTHRPLVNIYRTNGEEIGKKLLKEGFARTWIPSSEMIGVMGPSISRSNDFCSWWRCVLPMSCGKRMRRQVRVYRRTSQSARLRRPDLRRGRERHCSRCL